MSETIESNVGVEAPAEVDTDYKNIVDQLDKEGFTPSADQDDPDQQIAEEEDPETPEGIPAKDTLKVNGKTIEKSYAEIKEMAQKYSATEMKLETAKKEIQEARKLKETLTGQQDAVKQLLGVLARGEIEHLAEFVGEKLNAGEAFNKAVIQYSLKLWEMSKMTPEQREAMENKKLLAKYKAENEQRQKQEQERAFEYRVNQWSQHLATEVPKALKEVGLPDTQFVREHVISTWRTAIERGQNPTAAAVANYVKQRLEEAKMTGAASPAIPEQPRPRPKATAESAGLRRIGAAQQEIGYQSWDEWKKNRTKR